MVLKEKSEALTDQGKVMVEMTKKVMEEAAKERAELRSKHYEEVQRAKTVLDRLQTTYQTQFMEYEVQAKAVADLILQLKNEKEATEDKKKLFIKRIRMIIEAWRYQTKTKMDDCASLVWNKWSRQAAELQILWGDAKNRKKASINFYKMDE